VYLLFLHIMHYQGLFALTRNTHVHLCLAPLHRLCRVSYAGAGEARVARVTFAVGLGAVWY